MRTNGILSKLLDILIRYHAGRRITNPVKENESNPARISIYSTVNRSIALRRTFSPEYGSGLESQSCHGLL